jgi:hypothetical protein
VIPPDHHRRLDLARADELVDRKARPRAVAEAEPADARREPLEGHALRRELEPALEEGVVGEEVAEHRVDRRDVRRLARQRRPPERADAATEQRPDIGRDEARV